MNPIAILDLASVILSIAVFYQAHETQKSFRGLFKPAFVVFYSAGVLSLALVILEMSSFLVPETNPSTTALHLFMFAILLLILLGLFSLSPKNIFGAEK